MRVPWGQWGDARVTKAIVSPALLLVALVGWAAVGRGLTLAWAQPGFPPLETGPALVGHPAPDFTLPLFTGGTLHLRALRSHPVVLNFWASWCIPCRDEAPLLVRLSKTYGAHGVIFVGVDVQDEERAARAFIAQYHVDYPVVQGPDRMMTTYGVFGIPTTVLITAGGVVADKVAGAFLGAAGERDLIARLDRLVGGGPAGAGDGTWTVVGAGGQRVEAVSQPPWIVPSGFLFAMLLLFALRFAARTRRVSTLSQKRLPLPFDAGTRESVLETHVKDDGR